jgi:hypothetical protein
MKYNKRDISIFIFSIFYFLTAVLRACVAQQKATPIAASGYNFLRPTRRWGVA